MISMQSLLQRKCSCGGKGDEECPGCKSQSLQRRAKNVDAPAIAPRVVHDVLQRPGEPLHAGAQAFMESRFSHDFSRVRVHSDGQAAASASAVNAYAYTVGNDIVFGEGRYAPEGLEGRRLLAHELTHFIQQSGAGPAIGTLQISHPSDAGEREAEGAAMAIMESEPVQHPSPGPLAVARDNKGALPPQPSGQTPGKASTPASGCSPQQLSRPDFVAQTGSTTEFGLTKLTTGPGTYPELKLDRGVLQHTTAALPAIPSVFTGPGVFHEGVKTKVEGDGKCPGGDYEIRYVMNPDGAKKIAAGEQEHCSDFQYAFDISLARYRDAVNKRAGRSFASEDAAKKDLERVAGVHPDNWNQVFDCLIQKTEKRDIKRAPKGPFLGAAGWHTPVPQIREPMPPKCEFVTATITDKSMPDLGHKSSEIIQGCGETPPGKAGGK